MLRILEASGYKVRVVPTTGPQTAGPLARACIADGADLIIAAGGDGTINEVANGMIGTAVPLAILPGGTANCLGTELGLGRSMRQAARALRGWAPRRISVGLLHTDNGARQRYFLLMAGVGLDARIVHGLNPWLKSLVGKLAYWISGARTVFSFRLARFRVKLNGHEAQAGFVLASRIKNYGGDFQIAPSVHVLDTDFEVVIFEASTTFEYVPYFVAIVSRRLRRTRGVAIERAEVLDFPAPEPGPVHVQVDGEYAGCLPARIEIVRDALTLLMPQSVVSEHEKSVTHQPVLQP